MILIVSSANDGHASAVRAELARLGANARLLDLSAFPVRLNVALSYERHSAVDTRQVRCREGCDIDLQAVRAVWWRRPQPFELDASMVRPSHRAFAYNECHEAWAGLWQTLDVYWVNHPSRDEAAAHKAYQLDVARSVGLRIPDTLITNDPDAARAFIAARRSKGTIYKSFSATKEEWRETRLLRECEESLLGQVQLAPVIFQEYVPAGRDIRATIVGREIFAAAIHAEETSYRFDFRVDMNAARVESYALADTTRAALLTLMDALDLRYGAIDLRETADGEVVFLEINPAGQWLFIEQRTQQPITKAVAHLLVTGTAEHH